MEENKEVSFPTPKLDALEKLYIRAYLHKLSHSYAHSVISPGIKHPKEDNPYSRRENIKFHIALSLQEKAESLSLNPEEILSKLYKEATREDRSASSSSRIQALQILGKHLGLFQEKKEIEQFTFNVVNYSGSKKLEEKEVEQIIEEENTLPSNVSILSYSKPEEDLDV